MSILYRRLAAPAALALLALATLVPSAQASFSIDTFTVAAKRSDGTADTLAGTHPYTLQAHIALAPGTDRLRDLRLDLPPGFLVNPTAVDECSAAAFATPRSSPYETSASGESCPDSTQVGVATLTTALGTRTFGLFNLVPPFGAPLAIGAAPFGSHLTFAGSLRDADSGIALTLAGAPESLDLRGLDLVLWGTPWETGSLPGHDDQRGNCLNEQTGGSYGACPVSGSGFGTRSYLTMPTTPCGSAPAFALAATSWAPATASSQASTLALEKCNKALTTPKVQLMTDAAAARTGLDFNLAVNDGGGILNPGGTARPAIRNAILALPEGLTINPSLGAGLGTCRAAQLAAEALAAEGSGCPNVAKIGSARLDGTLGLPEPLQGAVYLADPAENPGSLISLYLVLRNARRGILLRSRGTIDPDPQTGRLTARFTDLPRLLYTHLELTLREGQRSTLVSPPACGAYTAQLQVASWAEPDAYDTTQSTFLIDRGDDGGPCPAPGALPFAPTLLAGTLNVSPGSYAPLYLRMTRTDAEQEITSYSATLPPGLLAKLAGLATCPDAAIEAARRRSGFAELAQPSCPDSARIGHTLAGYGVGGVLAYAPGNLYLAGPYHGAPLSTVAIDAATVGPFDLGTVVVRSAIRVDPTTAQVQIDSHGSDPIPHILRGMPLHLRDIRVYIDRPDFTRNPTSCDPSAFASLLTGAGADPFAPADDVPATSTQRFQLIGCSALDFRPRLRFNLRSSAEGPRTGELGRKIAGNHQSGRAGAEEARLNSRFPALRAEYTPRPGDANTRFVSVTLPRSLFVAQSHLRDICTRVQFAASACPPDSIYGRARAFTPLLDTPLEGPVYLRSANPLPNMVFALTGPGGLRIDVVGRIDTVHQATRATFPAIPDAPLTKFVLDLDGGRGSLLEAANHACSFAQFANSRAIGHNNLGAASRPRVAFKCAKHPRTRRKAEPPNDISGRD